MHRALHPHADGHPAHRRGALETQTPRAGARAGHDRQRHDICGGHGDGEGL